MWAWCASTISRSRWNEAQADARVRRHRLLRLGRATRPAHRRGRGGPGARRGLPEGGTSLGRRADRCRCARARAGRERRGPGRTARRPCSEALNTVLPHDVAVSRWKRPRRTSTPGIRPAEELSLPRLAPANTLSVRVPAQLLVSAQLDEEKLAILRTRSSASTTSAPSRRPRPSTRRSPRHPRRGVAPARRFARARDHGRQVPAPHGADAGGDDAGADAGRSGGATDGSASKRAGPTAPPWGLYLETSAIRKSCTAQGS